MMDVGLPGQWLFVMGVNLWSATTLPGKPRPPQLPKACCPPQVNEVFRRLALLLPARFPQEKETSWLGNSSAFLYRYSAGTDLLWVADGKWIFNLLMESVKLLSQTGKDWNFN